MESDDVRPFREHIRNAQLFGGALLVAVSLSSCLPVFAVDIPNTFDDGSLTFRHTADLVVSPKPLQTHAKEVFLKSEAVKGFNAGVTIDRVKINDIKEFASPSALAQKVVDVEKSKEGVFEADVISSGESKLPISSEGKLAYDIEYKVDSSRGQNHYFVKTSVVDKKLYVFTVQCKEESVAELTETAKAIIDSFKLKD
jgi:PsbP